MLALTLAAFMSFTTVTAMPIQPVNAVEEPASLELTINTSSSRL